MLDGSVGSIMRGLHYGMNPRHCPLPPTTYSNVAYYTILYYDDDMTLLRCLTAGEGSGLNEFPEIKVTLCDSDWLDSGDNEVEES